MSQKPHATSSTGHGNVPGPTHSIWGGAGSMHITPKPSGPTFAPPAPVANPAAAPASATPGAAPTTPTPPKVDPFFRPEDLLAQDNFWGQWNQTFAGLDQQLGELKLNTDFQRAQLADQHRANTSGINDDAAARGLGHSSIRDGNQAQEQTNYTRTDQNLQDTLNNFSSYVNKVKSDFQTQTLPGFNSAMDQQAVANAQGVNDAYVPPPGQAAASQPAAQASAASGGSSSSSAQGTVKPAGNVVGSPLAASHAGKIIGGLLGPYQAPRQFGGRR